MNATSERIVTIKARAFTGDRIREHRCMVDENGTVRVWDDVAGHYTTCHILSRAAQAKARKVAK